MFSVTAAICCAYSIDRLAIRTPSIRSLIRTRSRSLTSVFQIGTVCFLILAILTYRQVQTTPSATEDVEMESSEKADEKAARNSNVHASESAADGHDNPTFRDG